MNYRHAYHAGNFADVVKHIILTRIVLYMQRKDHAFRVIDTHAGIGRYDLKGTEAARQVNGKAVSAACSMPSSMRPSPISSSPISILSARKTPTAPSATILDRR